MYVEELIFGSYGHWILTRRQWRRRNDLILSVAEQFRPRRMYHGVEIFLNCVKVGIGGGNHPSIADPSPRHSPLSLVHHAPLRSRSDGISTIDLDGHEVIPADDWFSRWHTVLMVLIPLILEVNKRREPQRDLLRRSPLSLVYHLQFSYEPNGIQH